MENNGISLADIKAVTDNDGWGNGGSLVTLLLLFALISGGGFWGNNRGDFGQYATAASQQEILFGQRFQDIDNKIDRIGNGIADATFALNNAITTEGRAIQTQLCAINSNIDNKFAALEKSQLEQRIAEQAAQINQLQMAQQMCGVVRYPNGMTYNAGTSPFCNNGCGCN